MDTRLTQFETHRARLIGLAYRMLGEAFEAEDVVQDAYLRWRDSGEVADPAPWLTKVVTNLCLSRLTSARARRETYVGPWLPEPMVVAAADGRDDPADTAARRDSLSLGLLVLLERLTPPERAAFVLREAFAYSHREIARILGIEEAHARQLFTRARAHVGARQRFTATSGQRRAIVERFLAATLDGDVIALERLLADDAVAWADGGGRVRATLRPAVGRVGVARLLASFGRSARARAASFTVTTVNDAPAIVVREAGLVSGVFAPELGGDGRVVALWSVLNPDKLGFARAQLASERSVSAVL
ncbi:RNA polymerase sigma factor SigJ [Streptomyces sp. NBC_01506]|uniref:RNA polymerase sigma factor SigJ n=1 Tax=Streptomyces sp. NBC_01506 TaxID=2903887 RepID=UPI00386EDD9E